MPRPRTPPTIAFLLPALPLAALGLAVWILARRPLGLFGLAAGIGLGAAIGWIVVSVLWPARAERRCPACGAEALRRIDPDTAVGLVCTACGVRDETASGWLLAEEEGPLERIVARTRRRRSDVDRPAVPD